MKKDGQTHEGTKVIKEGIGRWRPLQTVHLKRSGKWARIPKLSSTVPWGYDVDPEHPDVLVPNEHCLDILEEGRKHLKNYTYKQVANWVTTRSGRHCPPSVLQSRVESAKRRNNYIAVLQRWARQAEEALETARRIEETSIDAKKRIKIPTIDHYYARHSVGECGKHDDYSSAGTDGVLF
jgi:hypothetical protein